MLIDLHCDTIMKVHQKTEKSLYQNNGHIDLLKLKEADALAQFFALYVDLSQTNQPFQTVLDMIDVYYQEVRQNEHLIDTAYTYDDIFKIREQGKIAGVITVEEGGVLEGNIRNLRHLYRLGVRAMTLTWNYENAIGHPNTSWMENQHLKSFGEEVVYEMNQMGMIIDVSHLSDQGFYDVCRLSKKPIMATHSNARTITNHKRNLTDEMLKKLAENGGVTGLNFCPYFIGDGKMTLQNLISHAKHIVNVAGIDTLAIGTDFDGIGGSLEIKHMGEMPRVYESLRKEGFTAEACDKIFYENAMRVIHENF